MYCVEALLRNRRYFEHLKGNRRIVSESGFEEVRGSNQSGFEAIVKLQKTVLGKLEGSFEDLDKPSSQGFDLTKLEAMKEKTNKNFFEDMNKIKAGKGAPVKTVKQTGGEDDILGLGVDTPPAKTGQTDGLLDLNSDFGGMSLATAKAPVAQPGKAKPDDFLDLGFDNHIPPTSGPKSTTGGLDMFDFVAKPSTQGTTSVPNYNTGLDPLLSFNAPSAALHTQPPVTASSPGNFLADDAAPQPKKAGQGSSDPFNFIVF